MPDGEAAELEALIGAPGSFNVKGVDYVIAEWSIRQYPQVMRLCKPLLPEMIAGALLDLPGFIERFAGEMEELVALSAGQPLSWVQGLSGAKLLEAVATMLDVNRDFFTTTMGQTFKRLLPHLMPQPMAGRSPSSAPPASRANEPSPSSGPSGAGPESSPS